MAENKKHKKEKVLVLIDAHAFIYRAFHALPPLTSPAGEPAGAVYGVTNILLRIIRELKPDYIATTFDRPEPTFRHEIYEDYKAQREEAPDDLISQFDTVRRLFEAFNIPIFEKAGYEADDMLGTLVTQARAADKNIKIIVASGDMDTIQLVDDNKVVVFTMRKGIADTVIYDEAAVRERYGFLPELLPDFKGLKGDPSDNIKGVPGVGDKTASMLVQTFGSLENIYQAVSQREKYLKVFKGKLPDTLEKYKKEAFFSRDLARIQTDAPIKLKLKKTFWDTFDISKSADFLKSLGFTSLVARLPVSNFSTESLQQNVPPPQYSEIGSPNIEGARSDIREFLKKARSVESISWLPIFGDPISDAKSKTKILMLAAIGKDFWHFTEEDIIQYSSDFEQVFAGKVKHNAFEGKRVLKIFWRGGVRNVHIHTDVGVASWVLDPSIREPKLDEAIEEYMPKNKQTDFILCIEELTEILHKKLKKQRVLSVFEDIEMPLLPILARMEIVGIRLDAKVLADFSKKLTKSLKSREQRIYKLAGTEFNINSPKQLGEVLFDTLNISADGVRKTGGGARSTRASELLKLQHTHPIIGEILGYREEAKLKSTYVDVLPELVNPETGRLHTTFNQSGTVTGRVSSQDPNLQNIPIRTPLGQEIRHAFIAAPGYKLVSFDYSQIELRLAASLSEDKKMIEAFQRGDDIHTITAAAVNHVPEKDVTPFMRRAAKTINFGVLYGMGAQSLSENLGISYKEANGFIQEYFSQFPKVKLYLKKMKTHALEKGYVETLFGRRRYFPNMASMGWQARREAERMAINAPIQGSDADIVKLAMIRLEKELSQEFVDDTARLLLQVHDELLFEIRTKEASRLSASIQKIMEGICKLSVPLRVGIKYGDSWYDLT